MSQLGRPRRILEIAHPPAVEPQSPAREEQAPADERLTPAEADRHAEAAPRPAGRD